MSLVQVLKRICTLESFRGLLNLTPWGGPAPETLLQLSPQLGAGAGTGSNWPESDAQPGLRSTGLDSYLLPP